VKLRVTSNVRREIQEAAEYYEAERPGLGDRFWQEVDAHMRWILANPTAPRLRLGEYRRVNLSVFPYYIAYAIRGETIVLLAVAHTRRKPHYWMDKEDDK
jgi:plasmid stabilization system protein ParE